jgi:hypothetical protein
MWYPTFWALFGALVYFFFLPETKERDMEAIQS